ncbi:MAG: uridine kinase [Flavobacteriaceae bacterium]
MYIIGVTGGTGSGKTTIINKITKESGIKEICYLSSDSYYKDNSKLEFEKRDKLNYDTPEAIDFNLLINHISALKKGLEINVPNYCFSTHLRLKNTSLFSPKKILIIEGILILTNKELRESINYNIFLDCPRNIRFERRLKRDVSERDRNYEDVVNLFKNRLDSMHELYVEPVKKYCDLIIDTSYKADVSEIVKLIKEKYYEK